MASTASTSQSPDVYSSLVAEVMKQGKGFSEPVARKALTCTGYRDVETAHRWLCNHVHDRSLKENTPREFILYLCPTGELLSQIAKFYDDSYEKCGWTRTHNCFPHITLTSFFKVPDSCVPRLLEVIKETKAQNIEFTQLLNNIPLELYVSQNYMGLYITKSSVPVVNTFLNQLKANIDSCPELKEHCFKESDRKFHMPLAHHFKARNYRKLYASISTHIEPDSQCKWELQIYSRDPRYAGTEVYKVVEHYRRRHSLEMKLVVGDYIFVDPSTESQIIYSSLFVSGSSWLAGVPGLINTRYLERTAASNTWISYFSSENISTDNVQAIQSLSSDQNTSSDKALATQSPATAAPVKDDMKNIYIMRHGERIDFTFGKIWFPLFFEANGNYVRKDLNMPKTLPERIGGPQGFVKDCPLTNIGELQALITGEAMKDTGIKIEHAFVSPAYRCIQTAHNVLLGLGLNKSIPLCIEPGLFEWTAWYTECFPTWLSAKELSDNGFFINSAYSPIIKYEHLSVKPESLEQYYNRSFEVMKSIIDKTGADVKNNNSGPLKSGSIEKGVKIKKKRPASKVDKRNHPLFKTRWVKPKNNDPDQDSEESEHSSPGSSLIRKRAGLEKVSYLNRKHFSSLCDSSGKKSYVAKKRMKGEEFKKKTKTTSYFKTRFKTRYSPMSGSEIETLQHPDSQNDHGLLSREQMSEESTFDDSIASTSSTVSPTVYKKDVSETLSPKLVTPSALKFGFLGIGQMGSTIVKNLLNSGHTVYIWNRTLEKCAEFEQYERAEILISPSDVVSAADITFCCVSDGDAAKQVVFGNCGVLYGMNADKAFVDMSSIDAATSNDIAEAIFSLGGKYLEVRLQGSYKDAQQGSLIIVAAGDRLLYDKCSTCFYVCSKKSIFLGESIGSASNMNLVLRLMFGVSIAALGEGMSLASRCGINPLEVIEVLKLSPLNSSFLIEKALSAFGKKFEPDMTLKYLQKDVNMALDLSDSFDQELGVTAMANEMLKAIKAYGFRDLDAAAVVTYSKY